jgi:hypothetical protein
VEVSSVDQVKSEGVIAARAGHLTTRLATFPLILISPIVCSEKSYSSDYIVSLRAALDAKGFTSTRIIASDDGGWPIAPEVLSNATLASALSALGAHYPGASSTAAAVQTGLPLFASEDNSVSAAPGQGGGSCWSRALNENYAHGLISGTISWSLICSWFAGIEFYGDGLMIAVEPWSGNYLLGAPIWASAHHAQAAYPGWKYFQHGAGVGYLQGGGTYTSRTSPDSKELSIVIEKLSREDSKCSWSSSPPNVTTNETATFVLGGSFAGLTQLNAWYSHFSGMDVDIDAMFSNVSPVQVVNGVFTLPVAVGDVWTLTTLTTVRKGAHAAPAPSAPFPMPYNDTFSSYALSTEPKYWSDMNGAFEIVDDAARGHRVLAQATPSKPIIWLRDDTRPHSILGDPTWADVQFTVDVALAAPGDGAGVGVRCTGSSVDATPGVWFAFDTSGRWNLTYSVASLGSNAPAPASGMLPVPPPAPGTWHTVVMTARGPTLDVTFDGASVLSAYALNASAAPTSGYVGIATRDYGQYVRFDSPSVTPLPIVCTAPAAGVNATMQPCSSVPAGAGAWDFLPAAAAAATTTTVQLSLRGAAAPGLCLATFSTNPQTGAPNVGLAACAGGDAAQLWTALAAGTITDGGGHCLEVTKNELQAGARVETWACNGGANQAWTYAQADGTLVTSLDGMCLTACGGQ